MGAPALKQQADRVPNDDSAPSFDQSEVSGPCVTEIVVRKTLVVVCPERSRTLFKCMWQKAIDADIVLIDYAGQNEADLAAEAVAREDVPECFVLVPPFVCPTSPLVGCRFGNRQGEGYERGAVVSDHAPRRPRQNEDRRNFRGDENVRRDRFSR